jgi:uncharacterized membrane protein YdjX (TVP38/TMEM64 family)
MGDVMPAPRRKLPLVPLGAALVVGAVLAFLLLRGLHFHEIAERAMALVRSAGPWAFFASAAVLPAVGAPLTAFTIVAGELFAPTMTLPGVIAAMFVAIAVNLALTYWLARYALRPVLSKLTGRYGYTVPRVTKSNALTVILALRLTPGTPFAVQSYILGLAEAPFGTYFLASWLCQIPWHAGCIIMGKGILNGNFKSAIGGFGILVVATVLIGQLRKWQLARASKLAAPSA